jgi:hypothetical protein
MAVRAGWSDGWAGRLRADVCSGVQIDHQQLNEATNYFHLVTQEERKGKLVQTVLLRGERRREIFLSHAPDGHACAGRILIGRGVVVEGWG